MIIEIEENGYYSRGDEALFFKALEGNPAVKSVKGFGRGPGKKSALDVVIDVRALSQQAMRDLVGLLMRYERPLKPLRVFAKMKKFSWLRNKQAFWYRSMFGRSK